MFETKSGLRKNKSAFLRALKLTSAFAISFAVFGSTLPAQGAPSSSTPNLPSTVSFLTDAYGAREIQDSMTSGFAIEAFSQLAGAGLTAQDLSFQVRNRLSRANRVLGARTTPGYLVDSKTHKIKPGLAGKYLFAASVLKLGATALEANVTKLLKSQVAKDGAIAASAGNAQDVAWAILGLQAANEPAVASRAARALVRLQHTDGGFNYDPTLTVGGTDVTSIVIQALEAVTMPNQATLKTRNKVVSKAVAFLKSTTVGGDHFEAYGDEDPNGTAYAIMALTSAGVSASPYVAWLKTKLNSDGGLQAPWTAGGSDRYVTAQAYLPLIGKNYVSLLSAK